MLNDVACTDYARVLAELIDTALTDDWNEDAPTMALLWQASADPDDLRLAVKQLEGSIEQELTPLDDGGSYLAVAHSLVTSRPPAALLAGSGDEPVRVTIAVDHQSQAGVLRHRNGSTQWFGAAVSVPVARQIRARLCFEPAA
jgi:hypothetical protein